MTTALEQEPPGAPVAWSYHLEGWKSSDFAGSDERHLFLVLSPLTVIVEMKV